jgi:hypothetical protein
MANLDNFVRDNPVLHDVWEEMVAKGKREVLQQVLEGRFGPLSEELLAALQAADLPRLNQIAAYAGTDTLEQIRLLLGQPAS